MNEPSRVHVRDIHGQVVYDRLLDDGGNILTWGDGYGFLVRRDLAHDGLSLCAGWAPAHSPDCPRINYPAGQLPANCSCGR